MEKRGGGAGELWKKGQLVGQRETMDGKIVGEEKRKERGEGARFGRAEELGRVAV